MTAPFSKDAAMLYACSNKRLKPALQVIQAILDGMTPAEIVKLNIAPTLSIRTIQYYYSKFTRLNEEFKSLNRM